MGNFSRLHDTWMETMGMYMTKAEAPMASMSSSMQSLPFCLPTAVYEPQKRARLSVRFLFVCMSIVLLLPFCLGIHTEQTELKTESVSWNAKEWGEGGTYLLWDSKMHGPREWKASEEEAFEGIWKSEHDGNKIVTTSTNEIQKLLHSQEEAFVMDDTSSGSLRGDNTPSAVAEKLGEAMVHASNGSSNQLARMMQNLIEKEESGSMADYLRADGRLREGDIMRLATVLNDLGFSSAEDLPMLCSAFFETMAEEDQTLKVKVPAAVTFKLWRTLYKSGHVPHDDTEVTQGYGEPSHPTTLKILGDMQSNKRQWENRRADVVKGNHSEAPAEKATTFDNLHEHTIKLQESAHDMRVGGDLADDLNPRETSTGTPAFQRVKDRARLPDANRVAFSSAPECADKLPVPNKRRQSGMLNPDALFGRSEGNPHQEDGRGNDLWSALPDFDTSLTNNLGVHSAEGAESQRKLREKMIVNAVSELSPFNGMPEDFIEWRDNAVITFRQAGRGSSSATELSRMG
jgi:hypothetical protein